MGKQLQKLKHQGMLKYNWRDSAELQVEVVKVENPKEGSPFTSVVFGSKKWSDHFLNSMEHTTELFLGGTFRIKPAKVKFLWKVEVSCFNKGVPLCYARMENWMLYEAVIKCIVDTFAPQLKSWIVKVHLDYEEYNTI